MARIGKILFVLVFVLSWVWFGISGESLGRYAQTQINQQIAPASIGMPELNTGFFSFSTPSVTVYNATGQVDATFEELRIGFAPWNLLAGHYAITFQLAQGQVVLNPSLNGRSLQVEAQGVHVNQVPWVHRVGLIHGDPVVEVVGKGDQAGDLAFQLKSEGGSINLGYFMQSLPQLRIRQLNVESKLVAQDLDVNLNVTGDVDLRLAGVVQGVSLQGTIPRNIDLKVNATANPAFLDQLSIAKAVLSMYQSKSGDWALRISGNPIAPQIEKLKE